MATEGPTPEERGCWAPRSASGRKIDLSRDSDGDAAVSRADLDRERSRLLRRHNDIVFKVPPGEEHLLPEGERQELAALRAALEDIEKALGREGEANV